MTRQDEHTYREQEPANSTATYAKGVDFRPVLRGTTKKTFGKRSRYRSVGAQHDTKTVLLWSELNHPFLRRMATEFALC